MKILVFCTFTLYFLKANANNVTVDVFSDVQQLLNNFFRLNRFNNGTDEALIEIFNETEATRIYSLVDNFLHNPETQKLVVLIKKMPEGPAPNNNEPVPKDVSLETQLWETITAAEMLRIKELVNSLMSQPVIDRVHRYLNNRFMVT